MKPINYFSTFDEGQKEFKKAIEEDDLLKKLESFQKLSKAAVIIVEKNYHVAIKNLFEKESQENNFLEAREMFKVWGSVIDTNIDVLKLIAKYYEAFYQPLTEASDSIILLSTIDAPEASELLIKIKEDAQLAHIFSGTELALKALCAPFSHIVGITNTFVKDSYLLRDEKIMVNKN